MTGCPISLSVGNQLSRYISFAGGVVDFQQVSLVKLIFISYIYMEFNRLIIKL